MASKTYTVRTRYVVDAAQSADAFDRMDAKLGSIDRRGSSIQGMFRTGLGLAGLGVGLVILDQLADRSIAMASAVGQVAIEAESAEARLTSLFNSVDGRAVQSARVLAGTVRRELASLAAGGAGELNDYVEAYSMIYSPLRGAGLDNQAIQSLAAQGITAGFATQGNAGVGLAANDLRQALTQGVGDRTTPIVMQALQALEGRGGPTVGSFNSLDTAARAARLSEAFALFDDAAKVLGQTYEAQMATLTDSTKQFVLAVSEQPFDDARRLLIDFNEALADNEDDLHRLGDTIGSVVSSMTRAAGNFLKGVGGPGTSVGGAVDAAVGAGQGVADEANLAAAFFEQGSGALGDGLRSVFGLSENDAVDLGGAMARGLRDAGYDPLYELQQLGRTVSFSGRSLQGVGAATSYLRGLNGREGMLPDGTEFSRRRVSTPLPNGRSAESLWDIAEFVSSASAADTARAMQRAGRNRPDLDGLEDYVSMLNSVHGAPLTEKGMAEAMKEALGKQGPPPPPVIKVQPRFVWGDDRQTIVSMERMLDQVAEHIDKYRRGERGGSALPGGPRGRG